MNITDSQVHIWQAETPDRPWPKGGYVPQWAFNPFGAESLITAMDDAGVTRALLIPPAFDGGRNDYSLDAAERFPGRFGVIGRLSLDSPDAVGMMRAWATQKHAYGLRFAFFLPEQKAMLEDGRINWLWRLAQQLDIPLMIYPTQDLLEYFGKVANTHDGLRLTIDHLAVGHTDADKNDAAFHHMEALNALAVLPNVAVKASATSERSTHAFPFLNIQPHIRRVIDAFGPDRVFWGSDLTQLSCTYREAVSMFTEHMTWLNAEELELVMDRGVRAWFGWDMD
jgi:predicted TIM-barrel fold metal-dependent hydrolase